MQYELNKDKVLELIKKNKAKKVCLQFADGLKPESKEIYDAAKEICEVYLWGNSCFGACDTPIVLEKYGFDLIIQFGHSKWKN
ncbi:diphthamide synthesis protein [Candidatus Woesearchaeota archaeon]|nr:diphthamide synthesis protein [Candidatus Woesearchaeota archaeon]